MNLTDRARKNLESGATAGAGTGVCNRCAGAKEERRLNSDLCSACQPGKVRTSHKVTALLDTAVFEALAAEAARHSQTPEERITFLLTKKYSKPAPG